LRAPCHQRTSASATNAAAWIQKQFAVETVSVKALGLRDSKDHEIFDAAKAAHAIVLTKDADFC
jgi:predicted nuclease of predicted toxin-antitoxin system